MSIQVEFQPSGRGKAQCASDPAYPDGIVLDISKGKQANCVVPLPYPAPECGQWIVNCDECGLIVAVTAAGRRDDPVSIKIPCMKELGNAF